MASGHPPQSTVTLVKLRRIYRRKFSITDKILCCSNNKNSKRPCIFKLSLIQNVTEEIFGQKEENNFSSYKLVALCPFYIHRLVFDLSERKDVMFAYTCGHIFLLNSLFETCIMSITKKPHHYFPLLPCFCAVILISKR